MRRKKLILDHVPILSHSRSFWLFSFLLSVSLSVLSFSFLCFLVAYINACCAYVNDVILDKKNYNKSVVTSALASLLSEIVTDHRNWKYTKKGWKIELYKKVTIHSFTYHFLIFYLEKTKLFPLECKAPDKLEDPGSSCLFYCS